MKFSDLLRELARAYRSARMGYESAAAGCQAAAGTAATATDRASWTNLSQVNAEMAAAFGERAERYEKMLAAHVGKTSN